jgi:hypothetical protein
MAAANILEHALPGRNICSLQLGIKGWQGVSHSEMPVK